MKADSHMHDFGAHAKALDVDMEYYYTKRLVPLAIQLIRHRYVEFFDLIGQKRAPLNQEGKKVAAQDLEKRLRTLEDRFDEFVKGISRIGPGWAAFKNVSVITNDVRKERGDYDSFFHISTKDRKKGRNLIRFVEEMEKDLDQYESVLHSITSTLGARGLLNQRISRRLRDPRSYPSLLNGARIVAHAWTDPEFKERLLNNAREAARELEIPPGRLGQLQVVENTEKIHNVIVCTLCSCYPYDLLGNAPWWYKQDQYKTKIVSDPRGTLLKMFKMNIPSDTQIRVHDSTSDIRYMVLPKQPHGTSGLSEEELAKFVNRESLIGVAEAINRPRR